MRLEDEITKSDFLEYKMEIETERDNLIKKRTMLEEGNSAISEIDDPTKKITDFLMTAMDFTKHVVDREIIMKFVDTIIPQTETQFDWYMDFDLEKKPIEQKQLLWEFTIEYNEARAYRKETNGMLRPNQWQDLSVRVFV